tara:strand:+ start:777 stop:1247 length:471 start_codon:yes stop_codon:yes gene_type:complete
MENNIDNNNLCVICHENIENTNDKYTLDCGHSYHCKCIMTWFRTGHNNCPMCNDTNFTQINPSFTRVNTIKQIKNLGRRKNCPVIIKKVLEKIKNIELNYNLKKKEIKLFEKTYKDILSNYKKLKKNLILIARKIRIENANLLGITQVNPIYILNK